MRIRSTKPEFWRSNTISQLDWDVRFVLKGLEAYVDDNGVGKDDIELIAAEVFPRDLIRKTASTLSKLAEAVTLLFAAGLIVRYEVDGERLLYIGRWKQIQYIQKPKQGRFRRPDGSLEYDEPVNPEVYKKLLADFRSGTGEQGNRGTEEKPPLVTLREGVRGRENTTPKTGTDNPRGTRLPDGWQPPESVSAQMRSDHPQINLDAETAKFRDYWHAKTGRDATKRDWNATWRNWIRRAAEQHPRGSPNGQHRLQGADLKAAEYQNLKQHFQENPWSQPQTSSTPCLNPPPTTTSTPQNPAPSS